MRWRSTGVLTLNSNLKGIKMCNTVLKVLHSCYIRKADIGNTLQQHFHTVSTWLISLTGEGRELSSPFLVPSRPWSGRNHHLISLRVNVPFTLLLSMNCSHGGGEGSAASSTSLLLGSGHPQEKQKLKFTMEWIFLLVS